MRLISTLIRPSAARYSPDPSPSGSKLVQLLSAAACILVPLTLHAQVLSYAGQQSTLTAGSTTPVATAPVAIALDSSGNRYVVNYRQSNITEISAAGTATTIAVPLTDPRSIAVDSGGNLYVADHGTAFVVKVPVGGGAPVNLGHNLQSPISVVVDSADNLYIANSSASRIVKIVQGPTGNAQSLVTGTYTNPVGLALDSSNNLYVTDTGTQTLDKVTFTVTPVAASTVLSGLTNLPTYVAVDASGDVYLSGGSDHTVTMYQVPSQLETSSAIRDLGTGLIDPVGLAVDSIGNVYVADQTAPAIDIISPGSIDVGPANLCPATGSQIPPCSESVTLTFNVAAGQTLSSVSTRVLTQGAESLDFTASADTCSTTSAGTPNSTLTGPTSCSVAVSFNPLAPGTRLGAIDVSGIAGSGSTATLLSTVAVHGLGRSALAGFNAGAISSLPLTLGATPYLSSVIADSQGNLYFVDNGASCVVEKYTLATRATSIVAGSGTCGTASSGSGGPATSAVFIDPWRLALDGRGDLYISDDKANVIWKVDAVTQIITPAAGTPGVAGHSADGIVASTATLDTPYALTVDGAGNLYFTDYHDEIVRKVDAVSGVLSTVAGNYNAGVGFSGDGGPATLAQLNNPIALTVDTDGNLYIVDVGNQVIREVTAATGIISTFAGTPGTAGFSGDGMDATLAQISHPEGVAVDAAHNVYIADSGNFVVREVSAGTNLISTIAGIPGSTLYTGDGGPANLAGLSDVADVAVDSSGNLYFADVSNSALREVTVASGIIDFAGTNIGSTSASVDVILTNNGNQPLVLSALGSAANFSTAGADTSCTSSTTLTPGLSCILGVEFLPTSAGALTGTISLSDNVGNNPASTQSLALSGTGTYVPTQVVLAAVPASITTPGNLGTLQASVESSGGNVVTNSTANVTATLTGPAGYSHVVTAAAVSGVATLDLSGLPLTTAGTYTVTVSSPGLTSSAVTVTAIAPATQLAVTGIPASLVAGGNLGMAVATIEAADGSVITTSTATVAITVTGPASYSQVVTASAVSGVATLDLSSLTLTTAGTYTVTATSPNLRSVTDTVTVAALDFTLAVTTGTAGSSTQTVTAGGSATYPFTLAPTSGSYAQAITFTASGLPPGATYSFSPSTVTPGAAPATTTLTIVTVAASAANFHPFYRPTNGLGSLALALLLLPLAASRRLRKVAGQLPLLTLALGLLSLGAVGTLSGCGGTSNTKVSPPIAQSYTITVTATSGAVSHTTNVTLIVQ